MCFLLQAFEPVPTPDVNRQPHVSRERPNAAVTSCTAADLSGVPKNVDAWGSWEQAICCRKPFDAATSQRNTLKSERQALLVKRAKSATTALCGSPASGNQSAKPRGKNGLFLR